MIAGGRELVRDGNAEEPLGHSMRTLPDYLRKGMKMILVGANPGDRSARVGHYYAGRNNQFWPMMYESGVIPEPLGYEDDRRMVEFGIGMTDLVKRPTRGVEEIERQEFAEGRVLLKICGRGSSRSTARWSMKNSRAARANLDCRRNCSTGLVFSYFLRRARKMRVPV